MIRSLFKHRHTPSVASLIVTCAIFIGGFQFGIEPAYAQIEAIQDLFLELIWAFVVNVFGFWFTLGAWTLLYGLGLFVVGFGENYIYTSLGLAVDQMWTVIRDLFNIALIFGLIYLGLIMILNLGSRDTKKWLITLILAALLVNFSLYITKFVIDATNLVAIQFLGQYPTVAGEPPFDVPSLGNSRPPIQIPDISLGIAELMGLSSFFSQQGSGLPEDAGFAYIVIMALFLFISGFVFFAGGILMFLRFIALNFYLIFSPLLFLGWVFPNLGGISTKYWRGFFNRAIVAPVYVILIYISMSILVVYVADPVSFDPKDTNFVSLIDTQTASTDITGYQDDFLATFVKFAVIIGFLIFSLVAAQKLGVEGANAAVSTGKAVRDRGKRFALRNTAGYGAWAVSRSSQGGLRAYNRFQASDRGSSRLARFGRGTLNTVTLGATADRNVRSALKAGEGATIAGSETAEQRQKRLASRTSELNQVRNEMNRSEDVSTAITQMETAGTTAAELTTAFSKLGRAVSKMNDEEINNLKSDVLKDRRIAVQLTDEQLKSLESSGKKTTQEIKAIKDQREAGFKEIAEQGYVTKAGVGNGPDIPDTAKNDPNFGSYIATQRRFVTNRSLQQAGSLPAEIFSVGATKNAADGSYSTGTPQPEMYAQIAPRVLEERMRNGGLMQGQIDQIKLNLEAYLNNPNTPESARKSWRNWAERDGGVYAAQLNLQIPRASNSSSTGTGNNSNP